MKSTHDFISVALLVFLLACSGGKKTAEASSSLAHTPDSLVEMVRIKAIVNGAGETLGLYKFDGIGFKHLKDIPSLHGDTFIFELPQGEPDLFYLGKGNLPKRPMVVGPEPEISLSGTLKTIRQSTFLVSDLNRQYDAVIRQISNNKKEMQGISRQMRTATKHPQLMQQLQNKVKAIDQRKQNQVVNLEQSNSFLAKVAALDNYQSFLSDPKGYPTELEHYINEFFSGADLSDPVYNTITYVFEAFRDYTNTIIRVGLPDEMVIAALNQQVAKAPESSLTYKYALGGITLALQAKNHPVFLEFGNRYYEKYKTEQSPHVQNLGRQLNNAKSLAIGALAPDFTQNTPEGNPMNLSDLRGKVVLVDFWASWCGPCRRENPKVVKLYEKYKDKGFEILGVSLDRQKDRWLGAIEKDGLTWHHVSDLKGWKNEVAATYAVRSIPHTVLLDAKGHILARNLRGPALDKHLEEIFGF